MRVYLDEQSRIDQLAKRLSPETVRQLFRRVQEVRRAIPSHINAHLSLEHVFLATSL
jgi:ABC-type phosphate/phosphonate transport system permease subunit